MDNSEKKTSKQKTLDLNQPQATILIGWLFKVIKWKQILGKHPLQPKPEEVDDGFKVFWY